jgi:hypothetical protein
MQAVGCGCFLGLVFGLVAESWKGRGAACFVPSGFVAVKSVSTIVLFFLLRSLDMQEFLQALRLDSTDTVQVLFLEVYSQVFGFAKLLESPSP